MKKLYVTLITVFFLATSSIAFSGNGRHGGGAASAGQEGVMGTSFVTPRDFGWGRLQDEVDFMGHQRNFNQPPAPGAWSQGNFEDNPNNWPKEK
ncbi:MAG: hypothetical protein PVG22_16160 [Chromatiales bacterium]|jgi:hypothetical protein